MKKLARDVTIEAVHAEASRLSREKFRRYIAIAPIDFQGHARRSDRSANEL
jgi:hypothetical protein